MIVIPVSSPEVLRSAAYGELLCLLEEVEFANIEEESDEVIRIEMLTASETFTFDIVRDSADVSDDRVSVVMSEGESQIHYGYKLLLAVIAAFGQKNIKLTFSDDVSVFLDLYENLKGDNPPMDKDYRSIFPGLTFWTGIQLGMTEGDDYLKDIWRFV